MGQLTRHTPRKREAGMTLIELMMASVVLIVGVLGMMLLITGAIASNARNRMDSTATMAAQQVLEIIQTFPANSVVAYRINDCEGTGHDIALAGSTASTGAGAPLYTIGSIDFTQATVTNYSLVWPVCIAGGRTATYDVRWNIRTLNTSSGGTALVTVAARKRGASGDLKYYGLPVSLRAIVGP